MSIVVLLSGGLDSVVSMALAAKCHPQMEIYPLFVQYGQANLFNEWGAAETAVRRQRLISKNKVHDLILRKIEGLGGSTLISTDGDGIPLNRSDSDRTNTISSVYVPMRNLVFLSIAASLAETVKAWFIYIGLSGGGPDSVTSWRLMGKKVTPIYPIAFPDCTKDFLKRFQLTIRQASPNGRGPLIAAPVIECSKASILNTGIELGVLTGETWSCFKGGPIPCGLCDACWYRNRASQFANGV